MEFIPQKRTDVGVEEFFNDKLEEFFRHSSFINALLALELHVQLLLQVFRVVHGCHLQLKHKKAEKTLRKT